MNVPIHNPKINQGFTLLELMVVLAIISTIYAMSQVSFEPLANRLSQSEHLQSAVQQVQTCALTARQTARLQTCQIDGYRRQGPALVVYADGSSNGGSFIADSNDHTLIVDSLTSQVRIIP